MSDIISKEELERRVKSEIAKARAQFDEESKRMSDGVDASTFKSHLLWGDYIYSSDFEQDVRSDIIKSEKRNKKFRSKIRKQKKNFIPHQSCELECVKMPKSEPWDEDRFKLVLKTTGETVDDAQGFGYKSENGAFRAYAWRRHQYDAVKREEQAEKLNDNLKSLKDAINGVDTSIQENKIE